MTVSQLLDIVISNLNGISVPRYLNQQIGVQIDNAVENLRACLEAMTSSKQEPQKENEEVQDAET